MKKLNLNSLFLIIAFTLVIFTGCDKEDDLMAPELGSTEVLYISHNSATIAGSITSDADVSISDRGVCWSTESGPTINDNSIVTGGSDNNFTIEIEDLDLETTYYVRTFATNDDGTAYGSEVTITTTSSLEDIDGNTYNTVVIGDQNWMAANLITTTYNDGESIPNVTDNSSWSNLETHAYAWFDNNPDRDDLGAYYNWYTVSTGKICPSGWRVPNEADWDTLIDFLGSNPGDKLKRTPTAMYGNANETGFTAIMSGYRGGGNGAFGSVGEWAIYWIGEDYDLSQEWPDLIKLESTSTGVDKTFFSPQTGASIRCIKE